jgi:hypothetical protein
MDTPKPNECRQWNTFSQCYQKVIRLWCQLRDEERLLHVVNITFEICHGASSIFHVGVILTESHCHHPAFDDGAKGDTRQHLPTEGAPLGEWLHLRNRENFTGPGQYDGSPSATWKSNQPGTPHTGRPGHQSSTIATGVRENKEFPRPPPTETRKISRSPGPHTAPESSPRPGFDPDERQPPPTIDDSAARDNTAELGAPCEVAASPSSARRLAAPAY